MTDTPGQKRKFLGIMFDCCGVYSRIYANAAATAYQGRCPKCLKAVKVRVDKQKGVDTRFLRVQ